MISFEKKPEEMNQAMQITEDRAISKGTFGWNKFESSRNSIEARVAGAEHVRRKGRW